MPAPSLQALLAGVIDYAGLFPPAKLPLGPAWQNFRKYQQSPLAWMLGRFVCPADKLTELPAEETPLRATDLSVLGIVAADDLQGWTKAWDETTSAIARIDEARRVHLDTIEIRAPQTTGDALTTVMAGDANARLTVYLELPLGDGWQSRLAAMVASIRQHQNHHGSTHPVGLKLRTGGLEASAFPSIEQIAAVIVACRDADVFWKATAGLHHPIRHLNAGVAARMHGFINVLAADVLARVHHLKLDEVSAVLAEEDAGRFSFADAMTWRGSAQSYSATAEQITAVRVKSLQSFGSCSFDEPVEDLRALGWFEPA